MKKILLLFIILTTLICIGCSKEKTMQMSISDSVSESSEENFDTSATVQQLFSEAVTKDNYEMAKWALITATDIINQLKDKDLGSALYITRSMLKSDEEVFLDDITLEQLKEKLNIQVITCQNEGKDFVEKIVY